MKKILLLSVLVLCFSCSDDEMDYSAQNEIDILAYIQESNLNFLKSNSGLYYRISSSGSGVSPNVNSNVTLGYKGYLLNGDVFDQSTSASFNVSGVVQGFGEAVRLLKPGASGTFILPSKLGYGNTGSGNSIKGGDVIIFDINLIRIN
jgi:FKBP-type peptidyl-prolyl cis-trans isomerase FkpA